MTKGQSMFLFSALGVIFVLGGGYCALEDHLYQDPRPWPLPVLLIGAVLLAVCVLSHINSKKQRQADAEAEARRKAEAEEKRAREKVEREEQVRRHIEQEAAEPVQPNPEEHTEEANTTEELSSNNPILKNSRAKISLLQSPFISQNYISRAKRRFLAFDVETTGLSRVNDRMIEISAVLFEDGEAKSSFSTLINPGIPISEKASSVNGIYNQDVADAPNEHDAVLAFLDFIGPEAQRGETIMVAHNAEFDAAFLREAVVRLDLSITFEIQDTLALARRLPVRSENKKLGTLAEYFGIEQKHGHRAQDDARVCGEIFLKLLDIQEKIWKQNASALNEDELRVCYWYKGLFEEAGFNTDLLTFDAGQYLRVKYGVKTVSKLNLSAKRPYVIVSPDLSLPDGCEIVPASKAEGIGVARLRISSVDDLEPVKASMLDRYVRMSEETDNNMGELVQGIEKLYENISI